MERIEKSVFISYRRSNLPWALAIFQNLTQHGYDVFLDYSGISSGDFEQVILGNIKASAHFLVALTPSALERCKDPEDWLRREIETAVANQRNIVPLLLEGFDFGAPAIEEQLTGELAALKHYNGLKIPPDYFDEAMERLRNRYLNIPLTAVLHPASPAAQKAGVEQKKAADAAPMVQEEELSANQWFAGGLAAVDIDEKLRFYSEAIRLKPDYPSAFSNRGLLWAAKGDFEKATKDYNEAIRLKPDYSEAYYNRALARHAKGDSAGEIQDYSEAIRLNPGDPDAFNNRGNAWNAAGDSERAIRDLNEAIRLKPNYPFAFSNRGMVRAAKGDFDGAIRDYSEAIRLKPDYATAFNNRGSARLAKHDFEGAVQDYSEAIRLKPDYTGAFANRAIARPYVGDMEGASADSAHAARLAAGKRS